MTKITRMQCKALMGALQNAYEIAHIETDTIPQNGEVIEFGIRWDHRGNQSTEAAKKFMAELKNATLVADHLNQMEIEVDDDAEEKIITSIATYGNTQNDLKNGFRQGSLLHFRRMVRINGLND